MELDWHHPERIAAAAGLDLDCPRCNAVATTLCVGTMDDERHAGQELGNLGIHVDRLIAWERLMTA
jgi:hypothetical protein